jgi:hypothetical protein
MGYGENHGDSRLKEQLGKNTRQTVEKLCAIEQALTGNQTPGTGITTGVDCNGVSFNASGVQTIPHPSAVQLVKICPSTNKDPEVVCISNDGGITVVSGWEVFTISNSGVVTSTIYLNGVDVSATYKIVPCGIKAKYDYEIEKVCVDGKTWTKTYVYDPSAVTPTLLSVLWLNEVDLPQLAPNPILINNVNCIPVVVQTISDAFGNDLSTLLPGNSFSITKPDCCTVQIVTSIGTFTLRDKETYYSTDKYSIPFTVDAVNIISGSCTLNSVHIISNKTK